MLWVPEDSYLHFLILLFYYDWYCKAQGVDSTESVAPSIPTSLPPRKVRVVKDRPVAAHHELGTVRCAVLGGSRDASPHALTGP